MKILGIIPARYASIRFPGKPLVDILGKSMIRRVYERCLTAKSLSDVVVATDDQRIADHVTGFGGNVVMTSSLHPSGTDRCNEVASKMTGFNIYINIQGDEPLIDPLQIDLLAGCFDSTGETALATLVKKINRSEELFNTNSPKVIFNARQEAIYFSRTPIPYQRNAEPEDWLNHHIYYKHIGIYAYTQSALKSITQLPVSSLESAEALEQLRWLENGFPIKVAVTDKESQAIDTPEDLETLLASDLLDRV